MKFKKTWLQEVVWDEADDAEVLENIIFDTSRWSTHYKLTFKYDGKYYQTTYSRGSTEMQDEGPFEWDPDMIECKEVFPVEKTIIVYE